MNYTEVTEVARKNSYLAALVEVVQRAIPVVSVGVEGLNEQALQSVHSCRGKAGEVPGGGGALSACYALSSISLVVPGGEA